MWVVMCQQAFKVLAFSLACTRLEVVEIRGVVEFVVAEIRRRGNRGLWLRLRLRPRLGLGLGLPRLRSQRRCLCRIQLL